MGINFMSSLIPLTILSPQSHSTLSEKSLNSSIHGKHPPILQALFRIVSMLVSHEKLHRYLCPAFNKQGQAFDVLLSTNQNVSCEVLGFLVDDSLPLFDVCPETINHLPGRCMNHTL